MADKLHTRVSRVIAGGAHALLDKLEDAAPVAMLEQAVREVEQVVADVRTELGQAVAHRHLAQQQHQRLNQEHDTLTGALATALAQGRDDLAASAIARQIDIEAQLPVLETHLGDKRREEQELAGFVEALMGKQREMERAVRDLEASQRMAESTVAEHRLVGTSASAKVQAAQSAFERTYVRQTGLGSAGRNTSMEQAAGLHALGDLVRENQITARLAALKAAQ
nr:PspA/IM30 family protein [uncultured Albidiferax sp.]